MPMIDALHPDGYDFDPFLFAQVGEDREGQVVSVVSALARLGLEPLVEANALSKLGPDAALDRLAGHLAKLTDVPALADGARGISASLILLLPRRKGPTPSVRARGKANGPRKPFPIGRILIFGALGYMLLQIYLLAHTG